VEGNRVYLVTSRCEIICLSTDGMASGKNEGPFTDEAQYVAGPGNPPAKIGPRDADIIWRYDMMDELGVFPAQRLQLFPAHHWRLHLCLHFQRPGLDSCQHSLALRPQLHRAEQENRQAGCGGQRRHRPPHFPRPMDFPLRRRGQRQTTVFFGGGDGICYAFDATPQKGNGSPIIPVVPGPPVNRFEEADTDYLKKVWWFDCNPPERRAGDPVHKYPAPDGPSEINATPVFWHNRIYVSVGQDPEHSEGVGNISCIDATQTGDVTKTAKIWSYDKIHRSLSTVGITPEGLLFVGDFSGFIYCFDANTGRLYWQRDMKAHIWGSTLVADGKVYCGDEAGDFVVFAASKEMKVLSQINLGAPVYSTPIVANGVLFVHSNTHLFAFYNHDKTPFLGDQKQAMNSEFNPAGK
jgi:hypothetical protein